MPTRLGPPFARALLNCFGHYVEGFVPRYRGEFAVLVVLSVFLAQKRLREPIVTVHDLGKKISFDTVQATIDLGLRVAVRRDDSAILGRDHHTATGAAEATGCLVPLQFGE